MVLSSDNNNKIIEWITNNPWIYAVIGGAGLIILVVVVIIIVVCCCYCCCRRGRQKYRPLDTKRSDGYTVNGRNTPRSCSGAAPPPPPPTAEERRRQRETQETEAAYNSVKVFLKDHQEEFYTQVSDEPGGNFGNLRLPDLGSRMQKYWFKVDTKVPECEEAILTTSPVSHKCPLRLDKQTLKGINELLQVLKQHPYLHTIEKLDFIYETQQVVIMQPYMPSGSLKDLIYKVSPTTEWSRKYSHRNKGFSKDTLRRYGRQILEAMTFLYSKGFPMLGHVQSGNIFVNKNDVCKLGGYENTIVGYKTRLYRLCRNNLQHFDVIMFGHLMFEMSCGYELTQLRPEAAQYGTVGDSDVKEILDFIFTDEFANTIEQIKEHRFFSMELPQEVRDAASQIKLKDDMKKVLRKVTKDKARDQPTEPSSASGGFMTKIKPGIMRSGKEGSQSSSATVAVAGTSRGDKRRESSSLLGKFIKKKADKDDEKTKLLDNKDK